jgi:hypothetical protein
MKMQLCDESLYFTSLDRFVRKGADCAAEEKIVNPGFFDEKELAIFFELIQQRRPLPVFHGDMWRCSICDFWSNDFEQVATHLLESHEPAPYVDEEDEEDVVEQDSFKTNRCNILF